MAIHNYISDPATGNEVRVHTPENLGFPNPSGLVVYSEPRKIFYPETRFFEDENGAIDMNIDPTGSGTDENIHDGEDTTLWTASNLVGSNFIFNSSAQANGGTQSVDATATVNNDAALFEDGTTTDMSNFTGLQGAIYVTSWPGSGTKEITVEARLATVTAGNSVNLSNYINTAAQNTWQTFIIPKADMGLGTDTVDELVITTIDIGGGQPPNYYLDDMLWVGTGGLEPVAYKIEPVDGENSFISKLSVIMADVVTETAATAYDKILGLNSLSIGITFTRQADGETIFADPLKQLSDFFQSPADIIFLTGGDSSHRWIKIESSFDPPIELKRDDFLSMTVNDNLSGLLLLRASCRVLVENVEY
jgi:hypothetical protein